MLAWNFAVLVDAEHMLSPTLVNNDLPKTQTTLRGLQQCTVSPRFFKGRERSVQYLVVTGRNDISPPGENVPD